jgi:hypothetical protein
MGIVGFWIAELVLIALVWIWAPGYIAFMATITYMIALWLVAADMKEAKRRK